MGRLYQTNKPDNRVPNLQRRLYSVGARVDDTAHRIANYETRFRAIGVEPPPPKKETNFLLKALDIIDRPRAAVVNAIQDAISGENSLLQGAWEGFTGKEKPAFSEVLKDLGIKNKLARGALGFVGDVLLDPTTYLTLGTTGVAKGAGAQAGKTFLKFAGRPLADVTPVARGLGEALRKTGIPELIGPVFNTRYIRRAVTAPEELPDIERARDIILQTPRTIKGRQQIALEEMREAWRNIPPGAAVEAARIIEAPTVLKGKLPGAPARQPVTVARPGAPTALEELLTPPPKALPPVSPMRPAQEAALGLPPAKGIEGITPTVKLPDDVLKIAERAAAGQVDRKIVAKLAAQLAPGQREQFLTLAGVKAAPALSVPKNKALQVGFEKPKPAAAPPRSTVTTEEMLAAARQLGIKMTPEGQAAARIAKRLGEQTAAKDIAAGVEFEKLPNYIRHLYRDPPEKVQQVLNRWQKERARLSPTGAFQKERTIPTLAEAKRLGLNPVEDVRLLTTVREMEGVRQRIIESMYNALKELGPNVMRPADQAPAGWKIINARQLKGMAVHPEVARFLDRFNETFETEEGVRTFLHGLNTVQNIWKGLVTAPNPAFHIRNALGNFFNNFLGGVINPKLYQMAAGIQKGSNDAFVLGGRQYTGRELLKMFREQGLEGYGFFYGESPRRLLEEAEEAFAGRSLSEALRALLSPVKTGRKVGNVIETNAKLAHFLDKLAKGYSPEQAAESVRKFLFDYSDLTKVERKIRDFVPFMTWTRKNIPLQLEMLLKQPGKMTALNKAVMNARAATGARKDDTPDWMKGEMAIPVRIKPDGTAQYLLLDLPLTNLNMIGGVRHTLRSALGMITPLAKVPVEIAMNQQIFSGAPIEKYPGARGRLGNLELPAKAAYALGQFGAVPRSLADIIASLQGQAPATGTIPPAPRQMPVLGTFLRNVSPEREQALRLHERERQLADFRRYLEEVKGIEVPEVREIKKKKFSFY